MAELYRRTSHVFGPIQEIPNPDARITLADILDRHGVPVARLSGALHPANTGSADLLIARVQEWLTAAGATRVWSLPYATTVAAGPTPGRHLPDGRRPRHVRLRPVGTGARPP